MTNTNILADGQVVSDKIKCINIGKQRHYSREIIHHLRVTLCLTYILFKLWHCRLAHESAIIFTMDTYIAHIAALKKSHSNSLPKLNNLSIPLAESFQLPMLQEGVCLRELWLLCLHNTQYAGFLCFGSDTLCDYWINWVWEKNYLELTYITFDLMQPLPPPENQQMLLFDCPHRTHKLHGLEICQQFCPVSGQWFHQWIVVQIILGSN